MTSGQTQSRRKSAIRLTWISAISFLVGGSWAWFIIRKGGPEALGAIIPMTAVGAIHIFLGPIAVLNAFKARQFRGRQFVYAYFVFYFLATTVILSGEALAYSVFFFLTIMASLLLSVIASLIRGMKEQ